MRLVQDVRFALRGFRRTPAFTISALLILAIGIGMAVAMFTVYDAVLVQRLPVADQQRIVELYTYQADPKTDYYLLREDLPKVAATSTTMRAIGGVVHWGAPEAPMLDGDRPLVLNRTTVTGNFFDVLGAHAALGRLIRPEDEPEGAPPVIVISYGVWQHQFGGDPDIVGRKLMEPYARKQYEIIGVAPAGLDYPKGVGVWMPMWQPNAHTSVVAVARLSPGASERMAQAEFFGTMTRLYPDRKYEGVHAQRFAQAIVGDLKPVLLILASAVGLLLLIACVNVGNLLLLRASSRARELSVRRALGASYADIVRQLGIESALLGIVGGVLGLVVASGLVQALLAAAPRELRRADSIAVSGAPMLIALLVTVAAILVFGVIPALVGSRGQLATPLRFDSRAGTETRTRRRARQVLVASQVALALVLLAGAGLLVRSLARLQGLALGYNPEHLSVLSVAIPPSVWGDSTGNFNRERANAVGAQLLERIRSVPGVIAATPSLVPPFLGAGIFTGRLDLEGQTPEEMQKNPMVPVEVGSQEFFRTFGIQLVRGRGITDADDEHGEQVAVVSEAIARRMWPNENPIGKRIHYWTADTTAVRTVVGVAGDIHWRTLREATPSVYLPWRQAYWQGSFAIRTRGELADVLPALRRATAEVNPLLTIWDAKSMDALLAAPLAQPRMSALLLGAFSVVSLLLAAIGLYGVMSSIVRAATRELGIRAALGASPEALRGGVLRQAMAVAGVGAVAGLMVALAASRYLSAILYEVSPTDPVSLIAAAAVLFSVVMAAAYLPARRATRVDPVDALRAD